MAKTIRLAALAVLVVAIATGLFFWQKSRAAHAEFVKQKAGALRSVEQQLINPQLNAENRMRLEALRSCLKVAEINEAIRGCHMRFQPRRAMPSPRLPPSMGHQ